MVGMRCSGPAVRQKGEEGGGCGVPRRPKKRCIYVVSRSATKRTCQVYDAIGTAHQLSRLCGVAEVSLHERDWAVRKRRDVGAQNFVAPFLKEPVDHEPPKPPCGPRDDDSRC